MDLPSPRSPKLDAILKPRANLHLDPRLVKIFKPSGNPSKIDESMRKADGLDFWLT